MDYQRVRHAGGDQRRPRELARRRRRVPVTDIAAGGANSQAHPADDTASELASVLGAAGRLWLDGTPISRPCPRGTARAAPGEPLDCP
jgi:hypothetical protein